MRGEPALVARDVQVRLSSRTGTFTLHVGELDLHAGEALVVIGPNGAGKSTFLRTLAGLERPVRGRIDREVRGPVTMVFQRPAAFAGTVEYNLRASLRGARLPRREKRARAAEALQRFGIAALAKRNAKALSGGELRRLALARAFVLRPSVLLLDEPFDDLDAAAQESLSLDLRRAVEETGVAVALVTHDLRRALLLGDWMAVLLEGRIAQLDRRDWVLTHPAGPEVAALVGMANFLPGWISEDRVGDLALVEIDEEHAVPVPPGREIGEPVWVGFRPEALRLESGAEEGAPLGKGTVQRVVSDGWTAAATLDWGGIPLRAHLVAGRDLAIRLTPGDQVSLSVRPEDVHLLPRPT